MILLSLKHQSYPSGIFGLFLWGPKRILMVHLEIFLDLCTSDFADIWYIMNPYLHSRALDRDRGQGKYCS